MWSAEWSALLFAALVACTNERGYKDAVPGECGRVEVGGNVILLYGIEVFDCDRFPEFVSRELSKGAVAVGSGHCYLTGKGGDARFTAGGCSSPEDQGFVDWMVPGVVSDDAMLPMRNEQGEITANVFVSDGWHRSNLQEQLVLKGLARAACDVSVDGDTCHRLLYCEEVRTERGGSI
jgi:hypothetical protein